MAAPHRELAHPLSTLGRDPLKSLNLKVETCQAVLIFYAHHPEELLTDSLVDVLHVTPNFGRHQPEEASMTGRRQLLGPAQASEIAQASGDTKLVDEVIEAFRARVQGFTDIVAEKADPSVLAKALGAGSDAAVVLTALEDPKVLFETSRTRHDPLLEARRRGIAAKRMLMEAEGGSLPVGEVASQCGISTQAVNKRRESGTILGVRLGRRDYFYPAWQFEKDGTVLRGLSDVLACIPIDDPWMRLSFFLTEDARLEGRTPLQALREGDIESVKNAARSFGEHGAP